MRFYIPVNPDRLPPQKYPRLHLSYFRTPLRSSPKNRFYELLRRRFVRVIILLRINGKEKLSTKSTSDLLLRFSLSVVLPPLVKAANSASKSSSSSSSPAPPRSSKLSGTSNIPYLKWNYYWEKFQIRCNEVYQRTLLRSFFYLSKISRPGLFFWLFLFTKHIGIFIGIKSIYIYIYLSKVETRSIVSTHSFVPLST